MAIRSPYNPDGGHWVGANDAHRLARIPNGDPFTEHNRRPSDTQNTHKIDSFFTSPNKSKLSAIQGVPEKIM